MRSLSKILAALALAGGVALAGGAASADERGPVHTTVSVDVVEDSRQVDDIISRMAQQERHQAADHAASRDRAGAPADHAPTQHATAQAAGAAGSSAALNGATRERLPSLAEVKRAAAAAAPTTHVPTTATPDRSLVVEHERRDLRILKPDVKHQGHRSR